MTEVINDKQSAIVVIKQYNQAIETCLEQGDLVALQETYDKRNDLIEQYFTKYKAVLNDQDMIFFSMVKKQDNKIINLLDGVKSDILEESSAQRKVRKGIESYTKISNRNRK